MYFAYPTLIPYTDTSLQYWYFQKLRSPQGNETVLVLGDSQMLSGVPLSGIVSRESVSDKLIYFAPRPSEQVEGIITRYHQLKKKLPHLTTIYVNISPLQTSHSGLVPSHKDLYQSFPCDVNCIWEWRSGFSLYGIKASDYLYKVIVTVFPFLGLHSQFRQILLQTNGSAELLSRKRENHSLETAFLLNQGSWTWKSWDKEPVYAGENLEPGFTSPLAETRKEAITYWKDLFSDWTQNQYKVVVIRLPFTQVMEKDLTSSQANKDVDELLEWTNTNRLRIEWIDLRNGTDWDNTKFADLTHLNQMGRDLIEQMLNP